MNGGNLFFSIYQMPYSQNFWPLLKTILKNLKAKIVINIFKKAGNKLQKLQPIKFFWIKNLNLTISVIINPIINLIISLITYLILNWVISLITNLMTIIIINLIINLVIRLLFFQKLLNKIILLLVTKIMLEKSWLIF